MTHLLHIDDDHFYCHTLKRVFEANQYIVRCAHHGEEGLALAEEDLPDVILLDIAMPKKNGFEVLEQLRAAKATKHIPVIMLTHLGAKEDVLRCLELGAASYLIKTHHGPKDIVQHVNRIVEEHGKKNAFTVRELVVAIGVLLGALTVGVWLFSARLEELRQDERAAAIERQQQSVSVPEGSRP